MQPLPVPPQARSPAGRRRPLAPLRLTDGAAARVAAEVPDRDGRWAWPVDGLLRHLTAAGWPTEVYAITVTLPASVDAGGWHRPERRQDVDAKCVPRTWLLRLAVAAGLPGRDRRAVIPDRVTA